MSISGISSSNITTVLSANRPVANQQAGVLGVAAGGGEAPDGDSAAVEKAESGAAKISERTGVYLNKLL